jgi:hypothetical protein
LLLAALMFLLIAMIQVAVNLIHSQPEKWAALAEGPWAVLAEPTYWPRLLHFVLAAVAFSGAVMAWWAVRRARQGENPEINRDIARFCWRWALWAIVLQVVDGLVLLLLLPPRVLKGVMVGGAGTMIPLVLAILLGLVLLLMMARSAEPTKSPGLVAGVAGLMAATIAIMAVTRHQVRLLYLEPVASGFELASAPQWGNFALFAVLLVAGLATVAYMVREVLRKRVTGPEAA